MRMLFVSINYHIVPGFSIEVFLYIDITKAYDNIHHNAGRDTMDTGRDS